MKQPKCNRQSAICTMQTVADFVYTTESKTKPCITEAKVRL